MCSWRPQHIQNMQDVQKLKMSLLSKVNIFLQKEEMFKIISCECAGGAFSDFTVEGDPSPPHYALVERYEKYLLFENLTKSN